MSGILIKMKIADRNNIDISIDNHIEINFVPFRF